MASPKMKKIPLITSHQRLTLWFIFFCVFIMPAFVFGGTFYKCLDKNGNETLLDFPVEDQTCMQIGSFDEMTNTQNESKPVVSRDDRITKVVIKGNQVLVPAKITYGREEANINLLMDTGASGTAIHSKIADQLYINLYKAQKAKAGIVGGGVIDASIVTVDSLQIGPHVIKNCNVAFIPHEGRAVNFDGLLGMDILGRFDYRIDLTKQIITWE